MRKGGTPLVGPEPFCGLEDSFFNEELKRMIVTRRDTEVSTKAGQETFRRLEIKKVQRVHRSQQNQTGFLYGALLADEALEKS